MRDLLIVNTISEIEWFSRRIVKTRDFNRGACEEREEYQ